MLQSLRQKYSAVRDVLHERGRRIWAATEAQQLGWGGISLVEKAIGMSHTTIRRGLREIQSGKVNDYFPEQSRLQGGGRKKLRVPLTTSFYPLADRKSSIFGKIAADSPLFSPKSPKIPPENAKTPPPARTISARGRVSDTSNSKICPYYTGTSKNSLNFR